MNPLISIITPVYNVENFITETIESVLKQTYSNWELILIDDGSTDGSSEICEKYALNEQRIKHYSKQNGGQASARNLGIKKAFGNYITFLDSDDLYAEDKLAQHFIDLEEHSADFHYGGTYMLFQNQVDYKREERSSFFGMFTGVELFNILHHSCPITINSVFIKKSLLHEVGFFDESEHLRGTEDWDLWLRISLKVNKVYGNPDPKVFYRIHENGIHFQRANMLIGKWKIYEKHENTPLIKSLRKKREYRYTCREIMNHLQKENRLGEVKHIFYNYYPKDKYGLVAISQLILIKTLPIKLFLWLSNKIIYRIGYRVEKLTYKIFLNE